MQLTKNKTLNNIVNIYQHMLTIKYLDNRATILQKTGFMHTYPCAHGHEAISTAIANSINMSDVFVPYYRDHGVLLSRNATPTDILNYWSGKRHMPKTGENDLPICIPISSQCSHAAGIAYAIKYKKQNKISLCSLGDGATSKGDFYESLNFSSIHKLPVIYLINNNQWAISTPIKLQSSADNLTDIANALNCKTYNVDGTDIFAIMTVLKDAVNFCRKNKTPVVIEAKTYRLGGHTTVDNALKYMPEKELEEAKKNCSIKKLSKHLLDKKIITKREDEDLKSSIKEYINKCANESINTQPVKFNSIFNNTYADMAPCLQDQKHELESIYE